MTFSDYLSIAGILVSVLFGIWGIYLAVRRAKYPAGISFVREQSVALLEDFAKKIPNLAVRYKDTPIEKNIVLLSGYLVNDGSVDITKQMTELPLTCVLPSGCSWLEFKVTTVAPALKVESLIVESRKVELSFGLFRRNESFSFQALVLLDNEFPNSKAGDFASEILWTHRIASLGEIKTILMPEQEKRGKTKQWVRRIIYTLLPLFYAVTGFSMLAGIGPLAVVPSIIYELQSQDKTTIVKLEPNRDGTTAIINIETKEIEKVDLAEFVKTAKFVPIYTEKREKTWITSLTGLFIILGSFFIAYMAFIKDYKRHQLCKLVAASAKET